MEGSPRQFAIAARRHSLGLNKSPNSPTQDGEGLLSFTELGLPASCPPHNPRVVPSTTAAAMAAAEVDPAPNPTSDLPNGSSAQDRKKSRESDRRRRRRKQKKNKAATNAADAEPDEEAAPDGAKENADPKHQVRCTSCSYQHGALGFRFQMVLV
jgi:hypothetical protein